MKKHAKRKPTDATRELVVELTSLRARVDEATQQFSLAVKAGIDEILHAVTHDGPETAGHVLPEPAAVEKMVVRLRLLADRPVRGRAKDLKRMQDLVTAFGEKVLSRQ